jgi:hypothetical protein
VRLPAVVTSVIALPFDQVFHATVVHATVKDHFDVILGFAVNKDRIRGRNRVMAQERVFRCELQLDHGEVGAETAHGEGESEAVSITTDTPFDLIRTDDDARIGLGEKPNKT